MVLGLILKSSPVFVREGEEKREKKLGFGRDQTLVGFGSHFFLLKDQTPYKKRLEEVQGNRSNPNLIFYDLDFWEKSLNFRKMDFH